jgi:hypothetical protein
MVPIYGGQADVRAYKDVIVIAANCNFTPSPTLDVDMHTRPVLCPCANSRFHVALQTALGSWGTSEASSCGRPTILPAASACKINGG